MPRLAQSRRSEVVYRFACRGELALNPGIRGRMAKMNEPLAKYLSPLLVLYYPFLLSVCFVWLAMAAGLAFLFAETGFIFFLILSVLLVLPLLHAIWALRILAQAPPIDDFYGLRMPRELLADLYRFVAEVARERHCP